eukprot:COSAG01_NODE_7898_length_3001_cov_4.345968_1_plen_113_part_00
MCATNRMARQRIRAMKQERTARMTQKLKRLRAAHTVQRLDFTPDADSHLVETPNDDCKRYLLTPGTRHTPAAIYSPPTNYQDMTMAELKQQLRRREALGNSIGSCRSWLQLY